MAGKPSYIDRETSFVKSIVLDVLVSIPVTLIFEIVEFSTLEIVAVLGKLQLRSKNSPPR